VVWQRVSERATFGHGVVNDVNGEWCDRRTRLDRIKHQAPPRALPFRALPTDRALLSVVHVGLVTSRTTTRRRQLPVPAAGRRFGYAAAGECSMRGGGTGSTANIIVM
jgi:hypothetical protein